MTQIIVTIEDNSPVSLIKRAISLMRGVKRVIVQKSPDDGVATDHDLTEIPSDIRSLIGVASNISADDIAADDRLAYILSK